MRNLLKKSKTLVRTVKSIRKLFTKKRPPTNDRDLFVDLKSLCKSIDLIHPTFIDGGAHNGSTILKLREEGFIDSVIYAFEPIPHAAQALKALGDSNVTVFSKALSNTDGTVIFNVNKKAVTSSMFEPDMAKVYHPTLTDLSEKISVPTVQIDTLVKNKEMNQPDIIKLDLQGAELQALKGSIETMKHVKIIYTEVEFVKLYKEQPLFHDITLFLEKNNFSLFNLYNCGTHEDGQILAGDALFVNNTYFKK